MPLPPRLAPGRRFPPYAYSGSPQPHPFNDPRGHSHGVPPVEPPPLDPIEWRSSEDYRWGFDLFNHGYYWEAHEAWEGLWKAAGKRGPLAEFLKGLIKLAAAGVKARRGEREGVRRHARRAAEHFRRAAVELGPTTAGLSLPDLEAYVAEIEGRADTWPSASGDGPTVVFDRPLLPEEAPPQSKETHPGTL